MERLEKINNDFSALFEAGKQLLDPGRNETVDRSRRAASERFLKRGIPHKTEAYIYTDFLPVLDRDYRVVLNYSTGNIDVNRLFRCNISDLSVHLVFTVNGCYDRNNSNDLPEGVVVCSLGEAQTLYPELLERHYDRLAVASGDGFADLNTMLAKDGVFVYIPPRTILNRPLQIINLLYSDADLMAFQRNLIIVGERAAASVLVCDHTVTNFNYWVDTLTEIVTEKGAELNFYQVENQHSEASQVNSVFVEQNAGSVFNSNMITLYGGLVRNNIYVRLTGEGAYAGLSGAYLMDKNQKVDNFTSVEHMAPRCTSEEHYKGILDDHALGNFSGSIKVYPNAQHTEAYQANDNLLLTDTARINSKPQLIIDADDVKCSHGATVGQIDEEAVFYLKSRGIDADEAKTMMMFGFVNDIVRKVNIPALREEVGVLVERRLRGEISKCANCVLGCENRV